MLKSTRSSFSNMCFDDETNNSNLTDENETMEGGPNQKEHRSTLNISHSLGKIE